MQSGLFIIILVVQSERLMCVPIYPFLISGALGGVFSVPQEIAVGASHLSGIPMWLVRK